MLVKVDSKDFKGLADIIQRNIDACGVGSRTSVEYVMATATLHATNGAIGVWVDSLTDPHALLIVSTGKFGVLNETYCFVNTIYVDAGHRTPALSKMMLDTVTLYAGANGCDTIQGSSWVYNGSQDISTLWETFGAEPQETIYVKHL